eukprot:scaffold3909_cov117-Isochrysis_galbana.AAC.4
MRTTTHTHRPLAHRQRYRVLVHTAHKPPRAPAARQHCAAQTGRALRATSSDPRTEPARTDPAPPPPRRHARWRPCACHRASPAQSSCRQRVAWSRQAAAARSRVGRVPARRA